MEEEISLQEIFDLLRRNVGIIIRFVIIAVLLAGLVTYFLIDEEYESSTEILVNQSSESEVINTNQIQTSVQLINTYKEIILSDTLVAETKESMGNETFSVPELQNMISVNSNADSQIFSINVVSENPRFSADFANALADTFSKNIVDIFDVDNVSIISTAKLNENPVAPNLPLNLVIAGILGLGLSVLLIFVREAMDTTVRSEEFLQENGLPVLGSIPAMSEEDMKGTRFYLTEIQDREAVLETDKKDVPKVDVPKVSEQPMRRSRVQRDSARRI